MFCPAFSISPTQICSHLCSGKSTKVLRRNENKNGKVCFQIATLEGTLFKNSLFLLFILFCYLFQVHLEKTLKNGEWNPFLSVAEPRTVLAEKAMAPPPVLLPGKSHGWRSLVGCSPWVAQSWTRLKRLSSSSSSRTVLGTLLMVRGHGNCCAFILVLMCRGEWLGFQVVSGSWDWEPVRISPLLVSMVKWKNKCAKWEQLTSSHSLCVDLYTWWVFLEEVPAPSMCDTFDSHKKGRTVFGSGASFSCGYLVPGHMVCTILWAEGF